MPKKATAVSEKEETKTKTKKAATKAPAKKTTGTKTAAKKAAGTTKKAAGTTKKAATRTKTKAKPARETIEETPLQETPAQETAQERPAPAAAEASSEPAPAAPPVPAAAEPARQPQAPAQGAPAPGSPRPRPLYVPRDVETFLKAAGLPMPTEKAQLDAIVAAMSAARAAATQGAHAAPPAAPQQPVVVVQQPQQQPAQGQPQPQQFSRKQQRDMERRERREQQRAQNAGYQQQTGDSPGQTDGEHHHPKDPAPNEPVEIVETEGYCEVAGKGFGFIRDPKRLFQSHPMDVFVTPECVKRFGLRDGHWLKCEAKKSSRGMQIHKLLLVNDQPPEAVKTWPSFEDLTTINPIERFVLETVPERTTTRVMDLLIPIGKGQRGLIVAPPRTGKTTLLNHIADAIITNHPEVHLMILLVDERPEEVTDFRSHFPQAELWASSNDMEIKSHTRIAQLAIERARRLVESGQDVFILLDSITRLGRAFNNAISGGGRTMSGGVDSRALETPRKIFASARNTEEAGSLTIVATALIETGSKMDELIFQEFKGTGNSEVVLDRLISNQRIYPAIDIFQSGTRREELIVPADQLHKINVIRRGLAGHKPIEAIERVLSFLKRFPSNEKLLSEIPG